MGVRQIPGNIVQILNRLAQQGVIHGFRTNLYTGTGGADVIVTVTAPTPEAAEATHEAVRQSLEPIGIDAVIRVDLP